ncbi:kinase-like protein [Coprinopsis marcescibilis]|uniref:Kinase-like protein n=1 Tax=Coprinopsis marcescibilis TaxID=230819 RepID=A0A5C3KRH3_COPMA|nr:kinase-like protein [Coprinopsis marcescibilis]
MSGTANLPGGSNGQNNHSDKENRDVQSDPELFHVYSALGFSRLRSTDTTKKGKGHPIFSRGADHIVPVHVASPNVRQMRRRGPPDSAPAGPSNTQNVNSNSSKTGTSPDFTVKHPRSAPPHPKDRGNDNDDADELLFPWDDFDEDDEGWQGTLPRAPPRVVLRPKIILPNHRRPAAGTGSGPTTSSGPPSSSGALSPFNLSRPPTPLSSPTRSSMKRPFTATISDVQAGGSAGLTAGVTSMSGDFVPGMMGMDGGGHGVFWAVKNLPGSDYDGPAHHNHGQHLTTSIPIPKDRREEEEEERRRWEGPPLPCVRTETPLEVRYHAHKKRAVAVAPRGIGVQQRFQPSVVVAAAPLLSKSPLRFPGPGLQAVKAGAKAVGSSAVAGPGKGVAHSVIEKVREGKKKLNSLKLVNADDGPTVKQLIELFKDITSAKGSYQALLKYQKKDAQLVLDTLQLLLDHPLLTDQADKKAFLKALMRLSINTGLYPECLVLQEVTREPYPCSAGHFSEVFKGTFRGRSVALKVVRMFQTSNITQVLKVFYRESILWSQLSHQNLLPFYGIYHLHHVDRRLCFISPWMENGNVRDYLTKNPYVDCLLLISDILHGVQYLHGEDVVHSDLKGDNILVTPAGRACLADFGLSNLLDSEALSWTSLCSTTQHGGTPRWQAPELLDPESEHIAASKESDMYSFGGICYEVLTGKVPFYEYPRDPTVCLKVMAGQRPMKPTQNQVSSSRWGMMDKLWPIMKKCWDHDPSKRPSASEILMQEPFLGLDKTDPRPPNMWKGFTASQFRNAMQTAETRFTLAVAT